MLRIYSLFIFTLVIIPFNVFAYLDPGTGSYIIQILIAALAGVLFTARTYWSKVKNFYLNILDKMQKKKDNE